MQMLWDSAQTPFYKPSYMTSFHIKAFQEVPPNMYVKSVTLGPKLVLPTEKANANIMISLIPT